MRRFLVIFSTVILLTACRNVPAARSETSPTATPTNVIVVLATTTPTPTTTAPKPTAPAETPAATPTYPCLAARWQTPMPNLTATAAPTVTPAPTTSGAIPGTVNGDIVNVRAAPSTAAEIVGTVTISQTVEIAGKNAAADWWQIADPLSGWVSAQFVDTDFSPDEIPTVAEPVTTPQIPALIASDAITGATEGIVTGDLLNVRAQPSTDRDIIGSATLSQTVQIIGKTDTGDWLEVCCLPNGDTGWLYAEYVQVDGLSAISTTAKTESTPEPSSAAPAADALTALAPNEDNTLPGDGGWGIPSATDPLTGAPLTADSLPRPVIVCINNDPQARPQFGIGAADVMYEYIMEGYSITRFSGIFFGTPPAQIGPIRSARLVNYYMGALYNAPLMCSGASDDVRYLLKNFAPFDYLDIDLDDPSNRLYTDNVGNDYRTRLRVGATGLKNWLSNWEIAPAGLRGFTFGDAPADGEPATDIHIDYPAVTGSNVDYAFDTASGEYLRFLGDDPHLDGNTGKQVSVENVVVQVVPHQQTEMVEDSLGNTGIRLNLFGTGEAIVFRDGRAFRGTWRSDNRGDTPHFFDTAGAEIPLKPGHTWVSIVTSLGDVTFGER